MFSAVKEIVPNCRIYFAGSSEMFGNAKKSPRMKILPCIPVQPMESPNWRDFISPAITGSPIMCMRRPGFCSIMKAPGVDLSLLPENHQCRSPD